MKVIAEEDMVMSPDKIQILFYNSPFNSHQSIIRWPEFARTNARNAANARWDFRRFFIRMEILAISLYLRRGKKK
jgi:hypothetical protein